MNKANHPPYSRRGDDSGGLRAIRVVWISFRPSEPETGVRILHRPPAITCYFCSEALLLLPTEDAPHIEDRMIREHLNRCSTNVVQNA